MPDEPPIIAEFDGTGAPLEAEPEPDLDAALAGGIAEVRAALGMNKRQLAQAAGLADRALEQLERADKDKGKQRRLLSGLFGFLGNAPETIVASEELRLRAATERTRLLDLFLRRYGPVGRVIESWAMEVGVDTFDTTIAAARTNAINRTTPSEKEADEAVIPEADAKEGGKKKAIPATQDESAPVVTVSKGSVEQWRTGQELPAFGSLCKLASIFKHDLTKDDDPWTQPARDGWLEAYATQMDGRQMPRCLTLLRATASFSGGNFTYDWLKMYGVTHSDATRLIDNGIIPLTGIPAALRARVHLALPKQAADWEHQWLNTAEQECADSPATAVAALKDDHPVPWPVIGYVLDADGHTAWENFNRACLSGGEAKDTPPAAIIWMLAKGDIDRARQTMGIFLRDRERSCRRAGWPMPNTRPVRELFGLDTKTAAQHLSISPATLRSRETRPRTGGSDADTLAHISTLRQHGEVRLRTLAARFTALQRPQTVRATFQSLLRVHEQKAVTVANTVQAELEGERLFGRQPEDIEAASQGTSVPTLGLIRELVEHGGAPVGMQVTPELVRDWYTQYAVREARVYEHPFARALATAVAAHSYGVTNLYTGADAGPRIKRYRRCVNHAGEADVTSEVMRQAVQDLNRAIGREEEADPAMLFLMHLTDFRGDLRAGFNRWVHSMRRIPREIEFLPEYFPGLRPDEIRGLQEYYERNNRD